MIYKDAKALKAAGITQVVSVGRRQPMHRVHLDCLREIKDAGLELVVVHGSVNPPGHRFYDPIENPLTFNQLQEQAALALGAPMRHYALADRGDAVLWSQDLAALIAGEVPRTAIHYRQKKGERSGLIASLGNTAAALQDVRFAIWESENKARADDDVHGHALREMDLRTLPPEQEALFADAAHIRTLAEYARKDQPDGVAWEKAGVPLTMLDLSLHRAWAECGIRVSATGFEKRKEILRGELKKHHAKAHP